MEHVDIAYTSDLILVVENKLELHVSSSVLCNTSSVFRAMLGAALAEGQAFHNSSTLSPAQLALPYDDAFSMRILCASLHLRNDLVQLSMSPAELFKMSILVRKYNCMVPLAHTATRLFATLSEDDIKSSPAISLYAACYFDQAEGFARITDSLAKSGTLRQLIVIEQSPVLKYLYDQAMKSEAKAINIIRDGVGEIAAIASDYFQFSHNVNNTISSSHEHQCMVSKQVAVRCLTKLQESGVWLNRDSGRCAGIGKLIRSVEQLGMQHMGSIQTCSSELCQLDCSRLLDDVNTHIADLKKKARDIFAGLCIDCFKARGTFAGECRFKHDK